MKTKKQLPSYYYEFQSLFGPYIITQEEGQIASLEFNYLDQRLTKMEQKKTPLIAEASLQLEEYLQKKRQSFNLPLKILGTDFQKKTLEALGKIPYGKVKTYKELAKEINAQNAARAIGSVMNKNPLPIFLACHRIIGSNKNIDGYAFGAKMKQYLLALEGNEIAAKFTSEEKHFAIPQKALQVLLEQDSILKEAYEKIGKLHWKDYPNPFYALVSTIVGQLISRKALNSIMQKLEDKLIVISERNFLYTPDDEIRILGISYKKIAAIKEIATKVLSGELDFKKMALWSDQEIIQELVKIKGVGVWTVEMFLLFHYHRLDIISYKDLIIRRSLMRLLKKSTLTKEEFLEHVNTWKPYSSLASIILWAYNKIAD